MSKRSNSNFSVSNPSWFALNLARLATSVGFDTSGGSLLRSRANFVDSDGISQHGLEPAGEEFQPVETMEEELRSLSRGLSLVFRKSAR